MTETQEKEKEGTFQFGTGTVVCNEAELKGNITFGSGTVVHPKAKIVAESGPIVFGENNLVEETAEIVNRQSGSDGNSHTLVIGNNNVFEIGSKTAASRIGDNNVIEVRAVVGSNVDLGSGCVIGSGCTIGESQSVPDNTVIYGSSCSQRTSVADRFQSQQAQMDYLKKALPNYHYLASKKA